jgi:hypothetical protein
MKNLPPIDASHKTHGVRLDPSDRRLLFTATLGLYLRRARHGIAVTAQDLIRLTEYADPDSAPEMERAAA